MGLFSRNRKEELKSVPWRDSTGKITCPGDNCPVDCDNTCPIYLNTQALMLAKIGHVAEAIPLYKKMVDIAPDFYDAWTNMGAAYGRQGEYAQAYTCYKKAHELSPEKPSHIFGLALSCKDLSRFEECLRWCDEYDKLSGDHHVDNARNAALAALGRPIQSGRTERY